MSQKLPRTIAISRELAVYLSLEKIGVESWNQTLERKLGVEKAVSKIGTAQLTRMADRAAGAVMVRAGNYKVIDRLELGDEIVLPWREDSRKQGALNQGILRSEKRTGHVHRIIPEYAGLRVIRLPDVDKRPGAV